MIISPRFRVGESPGAVASRRRRPEKTGTQVPRAWVVGLLSVLAVTMAPIAAVGETPPHQANKSAGGQVWRRSIPFPFTDLQALSGNRFVVYRGTGEMQVGTSHGTWGSVFRLAVHSISPVYADEANFLAAGILADGQSAVLAVDDQGREQARWILAEPAFDLLVNAHGRWASTRVGVVPLLGGGRLGPIEAVSNPKTILPAHLLVRESNQVVTCQAKNLSMAHQSAGGCERSGVDGWRIQGDFSLPIACGDWLLAVESHHPWKIVVYSLKSGKQLNTLVQPTEPILACAAPEGLFVGDRRLALVELPSGRSLWTARVSQSRIRNLAVAEDSIAFAVAGKPEVAIIPRPRVPPRP